MRIELSESVLRQKMLFLCTASNHDPPLRELAVLAAALSVWRKLTPDADEAQQYADALTVRFAGFFYFPVSHRSKE